MNQRTVNNVCLSGFFFSIFTALKLMDISTYILQTETDRDKFSQNVLFLPTQLLRLTIKYMSIRECFALSLAQGFGKFQNIIAKNLTLFDQQDP